MESLKAMASRHGMETPNPASAQICRGGEKKGVWVMRYQREHRRILTVPSGEVTFAEAQKLARAIFPGTEAETVLIGWFDHARRVGAPMELCADERFKVALDYAKSHGLEEEVRVNERGYSFFFGRRPPGTRELDPRMVVQVHEGLDLTEFANLQGG